MLLRVLREKSRSRTAQSERCATKAREQGFRLLAESLANGAKQRSAHGSWQCHSAAAEAVRAGRPSNVRVPHLRGASRISISR